MSEELSGMNLRKAVLKKFGRCFHPDNAKWEDAPPVESVVAVAWEFLEAWRRANPRSGFRIDCLGPRGFEVRLFVSDMPSYTAGVGVSKCEGEQGCSEAICRALVAAAEERS